MIRFEPFVSATMETTDMNVYLQLVPLLRISHTAQIFDDARKISSWMWRLSYIIKFHYKILTASLFCNAMLLIQEIIFNLEMSSKTIEYQIFTSC